MRLALERLIALFAQKNPLTTDKYQSVGACGAYPSVKLPDVSQAAEAKQRIALTDITVKYHRPLVNGRKIWGGLVPYGKVWRAGADENTIIEFSDDVSVEGKPLPKG